MEPRKGETDSNNQKTNEQLPENLLTVFRLSVHRATMQWWLEVRLTVDDRWATFLTDDILLHCPVVGKSINGKLYIYGRGYVEHHETGFIITGAKENMFGTQDITFLNQLKNAYHDQSLKTEGEQQKQLEGISVTLAGLSRNISFLLQGSLKNNEVICRRCFPNIVVNWNEMDEHTKQHDAIEAKTCV